MTGAVGEVGRRLSERLATRQDLQALSYKVCGVCVCVCVCVWCRLRCCVVV